MEIKIEGLKEAIEALRPLQDGEFTQHLLGYTAQRLFDSAWKGADKHTKTGALTRSMSGGPIPWGKNAYAIGHDDKVAPHAKWVHWGTRPHVIRPKDKKWLRWPSGGGFVFAKEVNHPGYKGDPWLQRVAQSADKGFQTDIDKAAKEIDL